VLYNKFLVFIHAVQAYLSQKDVTPATEVSKQ